MRGRKPRPLTIADADLPILHAVAHSRRLAWFQVQHARIVRAVAAGPPIHTVAAHLECDRATVWRVCRRYEQDGLKRLLLVLVVHTGRREVAVEATKDADHYIRALRAFRRRQRHLKGVFLIQDGDPSPTAGDTAGYGSGGRGWWRPRFTPAHAAWLNQAELLVGAFGYRYLRRASWGSREEFLEHVWASVPEYHGLYAHPFAWTWTNQQMRVWFAKHAH